MVLKFRKWIQSGVHVQTVLGFNFLVFFQAGLASAGDGCVKLDANSCWHAKNEASVFVEVKCKAPDADWNKNPFQAALKPGEIGSHQYFEGYADGLGYSAPGVPYSCTAFLGNQKKATLDFRSLDFGDVVQFTVTDSVFKVKIQEYWGTKPRSVVHSVSF